MNTSFLKTILPLLLLLALALPASSQISDKVGYGVKLGMNYSTIGTRYNEYGGSALYDIGLFLNVKANDRFTLMAEPGFSSVRFREQSSDTRYNGNYINLNLAAYYYPSLYSREFAFMFGLRPSYRVAYSSEVLDNGAYTETNLDINKNGDNRFDMGAFAGISLAMSNFINLEMGYNYSFTDQNSLSKIQGRPSTFEIALRLNAVSLKDKISKKERTLREEVMHYSQGTLCVMLSTPNPKEIERLRKEGKTAEVDAINNEIVQRNRKIMQEFNENYTLSKVRFFMDTSVNQVTLHSFDGIFVNNSLVADTSIKADTGNFFVAAFTEDISIYTKRIHYGLFVYNDSLQPMPRPYNHPSNLVSPVLDGDPLNYFSKKRPNYVGVPYYRIIGRFNSRLIKFLE